MPTSASLSSTGNLALARITPSKSKLRQSQAIQKAPATVRGGIAAHTKIQSSPSELWAQGSGLRKRPAKRTASTTAAMP